MAEPSKSNSINTVQLFQGAINSGVPVAKSSEDEVQKELLGILKTKKLGAAIRAMDAADGAQAASTPFEEAIGLMDKLGVNPGALSAAKDEEIRQLRAATTLADRELHEMRLREMESVERRMGQVVNDFVQKQKDISITEHNRSGGLFSGGGQPGNVMEKLMYDSLVARMNPPQPRSFLEQMQELEAMDKFFKGRYAPQGAQFDPVAAYQNNNVEMFKTKTQYEIEMEKMRIQRESSDARTKALTDLGQKIVEIIPDAAAAFGEVMRQEKAKEKARDNGASDTKAPPRNPERPHARTAAAANNGQQEFVPHYVEGQCPYCSKAIPVPDNAPPGLQGMCPYCQGMIVFEDEKEKPEEKPTPPAAAQEKPGETKPEE